MTDGPIPMEADETQELLLRIQSGDPRAFDELFARHRAELRRAIAQRLEPALRARLDASDVVQEAQLDAVRKMTDFMERRPMPLRQWLVRTAVERLMKLKRQAKAVRRDASRDQPLDDQDSRGSANGPVAIGQASPSQNAAKREISARLHAALARLADGDRAILEFRALQGLSYEMAGARLEIEPAAARKRYGRALLRLRALLLSDGLTESQV
jgi:RNA polymerase sigma-70 factor (ECF subfamily)